MPETKAYKVLVLCQNCGMVRKIDIPYGIDKDFHPCPNCGIKGKLALSTVAGKPR